MSPGLAGDAQLRAAGCAMSEQHQGVDDKCGGRVAQSTMITIKSRPVVSVESRGYPRIVHTLIAGAAALALTVAPVALARPGAPVDATDIHRCELSAFDKVAMAPLD